MPILHGSRDRQVSPGRSVLRFSEKLPTWSAVSVSEEEGRSYPEGVSTSQRAQALARTDSKLIDRMERNYGLKLSFEAAETYHVENYKVIDESNGKEVR